MKSRRFAGDFPYGRKAQMEMVGLVVIVILLTLGMLFLAQFALKENPQKKIFTRKGLAYSTVSALMKTTVSDSCALGFQGSARPQIGKDLLEDCAVNFEQSPLGYSTYHCRGRHSCVFLQQQVADLFNGTLGEWNKRYEFHSRLLERYDARPQELVNVTVKGGCPPTKDRDTSELFFLNTQAGVVESYLYVCD